MKVLPFFGKESPLSNWHPAMFTVNRVRFNCVEQFMMFCKAKLFNDEATAAKILAAKEPREHKALGREVSGFVEAVWVDKREIYVKKGCLAKFSQNYGMRQYLLSTDGMELVEASPYDRIWGVGLASTDPRFNDRTQWRGLNLLGTCLEWVRSELAKTPIQPEA